MELFEGSLRKIGGDFHTADGSYRINIINDVNIIGHGKVITDTVAAPSGAERDFRLYEPGAR